VHSCSFVRKNNREISFNLDAQKPVTQVKVDKEQSQNPLTGADYKINNDKQSAIINVKSNPLNDRNCQGRIHESTT